MPPIRGSSRVRTSRLRITTWTAGEVRVQGVARRAGRDDRGAGGREALDDGAVLLRGKIADRPEHRRRRALADDLDRDPARGGFRYWGDRDPAAVDAVRQYSPPPAAMTALRQPVNAAVLSVESSPTAPWSVTSKTPACSGAAPASNHPQATSTATETRAKRARRLRPRDAPLGCRDPGTRYGLVLRWLGIRLVFISVLAPIAGIGDQLLPRLRTGSLMPLHFCFPKTVCSMFREGIIS